MLDPLKNIPILPMSHLIRGNKYVKHKYLKDKIVLWCFWEATEMVNKMSRFSNLHPWYSRNPL